jgi:hypothetical protein
MLNPATQPHGERNVFTNQIIFNHSIGLHTHVRLRDGQVVTPVFKAAASEHESDCFHNEGGNMCWDPDGTSVTRSSLDMIEIVATAVIE